MPIKKIKPKKRKKPITPWLYTYLTTGKRPKGKSPGTWFCYILHFPDRFGVYSGGGNVPPLADVWDEHKAEIRKNWKGKTFAEKRLSEENKS